MRKYKKKNKVFLLAILVLVVSIGYALLSTTLNINGIAGINKNAFDIHWDRNSVEVTDGSVEGDIPTVTGDNDSIVEFTTELELPGDFYEFTVDAINEGTIDGIVTLSDKTTYKLINEEYVEQALPSYIKYSVTYEDGTTLPKIGDVLVADGGTQKYKVRVEYDSEATTLPEEPETYKFEYEVKYEQPKDQYKVTFDPDGGLVSETVRYVNKNEAIGELPIATKEGEVFGGWLLGETVITASYVPTANITLKANWDEVLPMFDTGANVNAKIKALAGNTLPDTNPYLKQDNNIAKFVRSYAEPTDANKTEEHIISAPDSDGEIYAWYDDYNIYWWSAANKEKLNPDSSFMFFGLAYVNEIDTQFDTSLSTNMASMFAGTTHLENLNLENFDTSNVTDMTAMFSNTYVKNLDLSSFDTHNVTDMTAMFNAQSNTSSPTVNLSSFDTSNVTSMTAMFSNAHYSELNLSNFDTHNVTNFSGIFSGNSYLKKIDVSNWDFSGVTSLDGVFSGLSNVEQIKLTNVNTGSLTRMSYMFSGDQRLKNLNLSSFDVSNSTTFSGMFSGCSSLKSLNISNWNFESATDLTALFNGLGSLEEIILNNVDTSNIVYMSAMFNNDNSLRELNLDSFDTSKVNDMNSMFYGCNSLTTISVDENKFVVDQVSNSGSMFQGCSSLVGGAGTVYNSSKIDKEYAHYDHLTSNPGYFNDGGVPSLNVTFNPNGGSMDEVTRTVRYGKTVGNLPTAAKDDASLVGWYTGITDGVQIDRNEVITSDVTYYAKWSDDKEIIYNGNGGTFENNEATNDINYNYTSGHITRYSHTPNINDNGVITGTYDANMSRNDVITIEGAERLNIEVWYSTEKEESDWLAIYPEGYKPNRNNYYSAEISDGRLGGGQSLVKPTDATYHKTFTVDGDTAQFYFRSDSSNNYYGYYAIITADGNSFVGDPGYQTPINRGYRLEGWSESVDGPVKYETESSIIKDMVYLPSSKTLYAKWYQVPEYTITFNPNGGVVDPTSKIVYDGETIGNMPTPTRENYKFTGWVSDLTTGSKVESNMLPTGSMTVYATWKVDFENAPWDFIEDIIEDNPHNYCEYFKVGDTREIELEGYGTHILRVSNCSYNSIYDTDTSRSQTANGLVIEFADLITTHRMNPYDQDKYLVNGYGNKGGWEYSEMRTFVNNDIYNALPSEIKNSIIDTRVISGYNSEVGDTARFSTTDKLYLLAPMEVYRTNYEPRSSMTVDNLLYENTRKLDYYVNTCMGTDGVCKYARKCVSSINCYNNQYQVWWLRGVLSGTYYKNNTNEKFTAFSVSNLYSGGGDSYLWSVDAHNESSVYVSPAFRIGG